MTQTPESPRNRVTLLDTTLRGGEQAAARPSKKPRNLDISPLCHPERAQRAWGSGPVLQRDSLRSTRSCHAAPDPHAALRAARDDSGGGPRPHLASGFCLNPPAQRAVLLLAMTGVFWKEDICG